MDKFQTSYGRNIGKAMFHERNSKVQRLVEEKNYSIDWRTNKEGHLVILENKITGETIEKQFGKTPKNIWQKVHLFFDFAEEEMKKIES